MPFQTARPEGRRHGDPADALIRRIFRAAQPSIASVHSPRRPDRSGVEAFLEGAYGRAFHGRIRNHYPYLMSLRDGQGAIQAAVGFRFADSGELYLEQYLDQPIELALAAHFGVVSRSQIVEVGNLAARDPAASLRLFLALAQRLHLSGATHVVATATRQLRRTFSRLGLDPTPLTRADPARLADGGADWGAYYEREPEVLAGAITPCVPRLLSAAGEAP